jgi:hypothetical protein
MPIRACEQIHCKLVPLSMWLELARRISMIMLIVAIATGFSVPAVQAQSHHGQTVASVAMSADSLAGCAHDGCPIDQKADMHGACFAPCAGVSVLSPPTTISYLAVAQDVLTPSLDRAMVDHTVAPDPHPPKQYELT